MNYAKKSLGQNYLIDLNIIKKIVDLTEVYNKNILEIGPGKGALTEQILKNKPKSLILIEKDNLLAQELKLKYQNNKKVIVYNEDVLKFNFEKKLKKNSIIFGNLPYNISSQILARMVKFRKWPPNYSNLVLMFQKEVADRIIAKYNTPNYGRLSILSNWKLNIKKICDIKPGSFSPRPKIDSSLLIFSPKKYFYNIKSKNLEIITRTFFNQRRKMLKKPYNKVFKGNENISKKLKIDLNLRPQNLDFETYYKLTNEYEKLRS